MKPFYQDNHNTIYCLDFRKNELPDESVQCVCTSPPYYGLRKYSGDQDLIWGGNENCEHQWGIATVRPAHPDRSTGDHDSKGSGIFVDRIARGGQPAKVARGQAVDFGAFCSLCGAWKGHLGLEPTIELYLEHLIEIMRGIRQVLRKDGVFFLNIADSYASGKGSCFNPGGGEHSLGRTRKEAGAHPLHRGNISDLKVSGLKPKDLCLIPFRVAIAAQEDGWWVRAVIIWSKLNPMPESVKDRPTKSHEYIIMLTKSARYFFDQEAVREVSTEKPSGNKERKYRRDYGGPETHTGRQGFSIPYEPSGTGRNIHTVWEFPAQPFPGIRINGRKVSPFAVFPEKLPELCIKAATPEVGCCSKCGAPWARVLEKKPSQFNIRVRDAKAGRAAPEEGYKATEEEMGRYPGNHPDPGFIKTIGWRPTCKCKADKVPSLVLDPLMGAGTTLKVAKNLNRYAVGYELSQEYCQLAVERCRQQGLL